MISVHPWRLITGSVSCRKCLFLVEWIWPELFSPLCICHCAVTGNTQLLKKTRLADLIDCGCCQLPTEQQLILPNSTHFTFAPSVHPCCICAGGDEFTTFPLVIAKLSCPEILDCGLLRQNSLAITKTNQTSSRRVCHTHTLTLHRDKQTKHQQLLLSYSKKTVHRAVVLNLLHLIVQLYYTVSWWQQQQQVMKCFINTTRNRWNKNANKLISKNQ